MTFQTFIFVHNQDIILDFIRHKKFNNFSNLTYVFLGKNDISKLENLDNVIIARNLENNIEEYPKLTSYTGWYALWKNNLLKGKYINLFEYDINTISNLEEILNEVIETKKFDIFGYIPHNVHSYEYLRHTPWSQNLITSLIKNYNINIIDFIESLPKNTICSMTSNHTFKLDRFNEYMEWVDILVNDIKKSIFSGHEIERSISVFYLLNQIPYKILNNTITHFQFDSHQTQGIGEQKFINNYNKLL
jgi:hypothetical protein